jgi:hypothetical protein
MEPWDGTGGADGEAVRVDASAMFAVPLVVESTRGEVRRLLARLRAEPRDALVALSNKKYRAVVAGLPPATAPDDEEAWGRLCGDVLVFHAARLVLAGTPLPLRRPRQPDTPTRRETATMDACSKSNAAMTPA